MSTRKREKRTGPGSMKRAGASFMPRAQNAQINGGTITLVGGNLINNHNQVSRGTARTDGLKEIVDWIDAPNFRPAQADNYEKRTQGTGEWFVQADPVFCEWKSIESECQILWGTGIPGAGKTLLASCVVTHLEKIAAHSGGNMAVCFVFIRYSEPVTARDIVGALVRQLLERHFTELSHIMLPLYQRHCRERTDATLDELLNVLGAFIKTIRLCFFVLDGLDEAKTELQAPIIRHMASLCAKLFITSRPLLSLQSTFPTANFFQISPRSEDIEMHVCEKIRDIVDLQTLVENLHLQEDIVSTIRKKSNGMFLHASLQASALQACTSARDIRETLNSFPTKIEDIYLATMKRINEQPRPRAYLARYILLWLMYSRGSMTLRGLQQAVATCPETFAYDSEREVAESLILSVCCGLISVEESSQLVRLIHFTAYDALKPILQRYFPHPHSLLASVCMEHLIRCRFQTVETMVAGDMKQLASRLNSQLGEGPLLSYAYDSWAFHARLYDDPKTSWRVHEFILGCRSYPISISYEREFQLLGPAHVIAYYCFPPELFSLLDDFNPNKGTVRIGSTPLALTCRFGIDGSFEAVVKHLLHLPGSNLNSRDAHGRTPLLLSVSSEALVNQLVDCADVDPNIPDKDGITPLIMATFCRNEHSVKALLLSPRIQPNIVWTQVDCTALILAARSSYIPIIKHLLAHPATDVNGRNLRGMTALMVASSKGAVDSIDALVTSPSLDVNAVDNGGWSALMHAAAGGCVVTIQRLLRLPDIQINTANNLGEAALNIAMEERHLECTRMILAAPGVDIDRPDASGRTPLQRASGWGDEDMVKALLQTSSVNVDAAAYTGATPLIEACKHGNHSIVKLLLQYGAQVNLDDKRGRTPLMFAVERGYYDIVQILLESPDLDINMIDDNGHSALLLASKKSCGAAAVVEILLKSEDLDVNLADSCGNTALHLASSSGNVSIVNLLVQAPHIQLNSRNKEGHTALTIASVSGHKEIVKILLASKKISDCINVVSPFGTTLSILASQGDLELVTLLLTVPGADVTQRCGESMSPSDRALQNGHKEVANFLHMRIKALDGLSQCN